MARRRGTVLTAVMVLALAAGASTPASESAAQLPGGTAVEATGKPEGGIAISIAPAPADPSIGQRASATVRVVPESAVSQVVVELGTTVPVRLDGPATRTFSSPPALAELAVEVPFVVDVVGVGEIRATVTATDAEGTVTRAASLWVSALGTKVAQSTSGPLDATARSLALVRAAVPLGALVEQLDALLGEGAEASGTPLGPVPPPPIVRLAGPAGSVTVSGRISYRDSAGGTHPVRLAPVEIRDKESQGSTLVRTVATDAAGAYTATVDNDDGGLEGGRDLFVRVLARSTGFDIQGPSGTHRVDSPVYQNVANGRALTVDLTANNVADNNTAFSVHDAMVTTVAYTTALLGTPLPSIVVDFPTTDATSNFSRGKLHILRMDRFDWDVNLHEFGHYFMSTQGIEANPGGAHKGSANLTEDPGRTKDSGTRLAWGEGFPTYFGTTLQRVMGTARFGIPNVGDTFYTDTEDSSLNYDLETMAGGASAGEDNEFSVQRALWDVYDADADGGDGRGVGLGDREVFEAVRAAGAKTFSAGYAALVAGKPAKAAADLGCVLAEQKVSPRITSPANGAHVSAGTPPTIRWEPQGGGPANRNDRFVVRFYDTGLDTLLFSSAEQGGTSFTPAAARWSSILGSAGAAVNVVVEGRQTNPPATGPYPSCNVRLARSG